MSTITELRQKQEKLAADARAILDQITPDIDEARSAELNEQSDKAFAEFDKLEERVQREERAAEMAARLNAPDPRRPLGSDATADTRSIADDITAEDAFRSYLVHGVNGMPPEHRARLVRARDENRAQSIGTPSAGGYTVPTTLEAEIVESLKAWGPMLDPGVTRELATNMGETINWPTMDDTASVATVIGENTEVNPGTNAPGDLAFGQKSLGAFKYTTGLIKVPLELAQDNVVNLEQVIRDAMAQRLGRGVNAHLTTGGGTTVPWGIVTRSTEGYENALDTGAAALVLDDMIELEHSVDPAYRLDPSCAWMFNDSTLKRLRKIKDTEGNYIWQPAAAIAGQPATILGYRYAVNQAAASVTFDAKPVIFGAMSRYIVRRVRELSIVRLDERYAEFGQIAFIGFARFDGELMDTGAVKHLLIPSDPG
jgi:HK97 family phage major capsid protein